MFELLLMRHGQAEPAAIDGDDFARPLTAAGRTAAARTAQRLQADAAQILALLYSPARRTSDTAAIVAEVVALEAQRLQAVPELYLATPASIRKAAGACRLAAADAGAHTDHKLILIVGHNPGLSALARRQLPTAGLARIPFQPQRP